MVYSSDAIGVFLRGDPWDPIYQLLKRWSLNRPFSSFLLPLFQNESKCETFHMKMSLICTWTRFQTEVKGTRKWLIEYMVEIPPVHKRGRSPQRNVPALWWYWSLHTFFFTTSNENFTIGFYHGLVVRVLSMAVSMNNFKYFEIGFKELTSLPAGTPRGEYRTSSVFLSTWGA